MIQSFKLFILPRNMTNKYDYILMTEFKNQTQFDEREANFKKVFDKIGISTIKGLRSRELADIVESQNLSETVFGK